MKRMKKDMLGDAKISNKKTPIRPESVLPLQFNSLSSSHYFI